MKIAIIGTRGIPNNYGGFEQLAEYLSLGLKKKGHDVFVYNSSKHVYQQSSWNGINLIHQYDPEKKIGTAGQFIYDLNCILNSRKHKFDAILNLGYTSSSIWMSLFSKHARLVTNMDGLEWKRTKYSLPIQKFLKFAEKLAVNQSDDLIADSVAIQAYLSEKYRVASHYIAYGADLFTDPDSAKLEQFGIKSFRYNMLIARMEPENNIEMILDGVQLSNSTLPFFVVGNQNNRFGKYLTEKYREDKRIVFTGPIYDLPTINNLRFYSNLYFHGHSVGGTNPSLLEAMGCSCLIAAHNNPFNKGVLEQDAYYFEGPAEISNLVSAISKESASAKLFVKNNYEKVATHFSWNKIIDEYERVLTKK